MSHSLSRAEFIALIAMLHATVAFSIDSMLPALGAMAMDISPDAPNRVQLVITAFLLGMGGGTLFVGPLADAFGRKSVLIGGALLYIIASAVAATSTDLTAMIVARFVQGIGASGPRVVATAIVRDLYAGRGMARIMSFVMMVFTLVPAVAPLAGAGLTALGSWRLIFVAFIVFATISSAWLAFRQRETLPRDARRPLRWVLIWAACVEIARHRDVRLAILAQTFCYMMLFNTINLIQPVFDRVFARSAEFPWWFAGMALVSGAGALMNSRLVMRFGMLKLARLSFGAQVLLALALSAVWFSGVPVSVLFWVYLAWQTSMFFQTALTLGNLNALAMEPLGHIAGIAASVIGSVATICGALMAVPFGQTFDGTLGPLLMGALFAACAAFVTLSHLERLRATQT